MMMMKLCISLAVVLPGAFAEHEAQANFGTIGSPYGSTVSFTPTRVAYNTLMNIADGSLNSKNEDFQKLQFILEEIGLFSITDIPAFSNQKDRTLSHFPACVNALLAMPQGHPNAASHTFVDGTTRKTIATTGGHKDLFWASKDMPPVPTACVEMGDNSIAYRQTISDVTHTLGLALMNLRRKNDDGMSSSRDDALLWNADRTVSFDLADIVDNGEHLEHFHVYKKTNPAMKDATTLDWHTDEGMMLLFSPGRIENSASKGDFFIQLRGGTAQEVNFDEKDELVLMIGDGFNHYVNNKDKSSRSVAFRAVPHALSLLPSGKDRVWYGRMVLPPPTAIHPEFQEEFGVLREKEIISRQDFEHLSSKWLDDESEEIMDYRVLQETEDSCDPDLQFFCWHRCFNFTESISPTVCSQTVTADQPHEVACASSVTGELWPGTHNPDFSLACVDPAIIAAFVPPIATDETEDGNSHNDANGEDEGDSDEVNTVKTEEDGAVSIGIFLYGLASLSMFLSWIVS